MNKKNLHDIVRKELIEEIIKEIKKRDLLDYIGLCYSVKDIEEGKGIPLGEWLHKLKDVKTGQGVIK